MVLRDCDHVLFLRRFRYQGGILLMQILWDQNVFEWAADWLIHHRLGKKKLKNGDPFTLILCNPLFYENFYLSPNACKMAFQSPSVIQKIKGHASLRKKKKRPYTCIALACLFWLHSDQIRRCSAQADLHIYFWRGQPVSAATVCTARMWNQLSFQTRLPTI